MIKISIDDSIYTIVENNNDLKDILIDLGFTHLDNPKMYNSIAKLMTIRKACKVHKLDYDFVKEAFNNKGFDFKEEEF